MNDLGDTLDMNSMPDFVILGLVCGVLGYVGFHILTGSVPGITGMIAPAAAGAVLGAMFYIFAIGTGGG